MNSFQPNDELKQNYYGKDLTAKSTWYSEVANAYDKVRPRYSNELIDFAIEYTRLSASNRILEIGCGSGIATTSFASREFTVTSLEPNFQACQLARKNCAAYSKVRICQTTLEEYSLDSQQFDAVLAATSIHWVDPSIGYPKIAKVLKKDGYLILLWNAGLKPEENLYRLLKPIYEAHTPSLKPFKTISDERSELQALLQNIINSGYFYHLLSKELIITVDYSLKDYLLLLSTYSPYIALEKTQRQNLFTALEECLQKACTNSLSLSYLSMLQVLKVN